MIKFKDLREKTDKESMKFIVFTLALITTLTGFAAAPPFDTNCVELGKKWGWISSYDPRDGNKRTYANPAVIQNGFVTNQARQSAQLKIWSDIDKYVPCLKDNAGLQFQNERFIIFDMEKFKNFRLNHSRIDCEVTARQTNDHRFYNQYMEDARKQFELERSGQVAARDNTRNVQFEQKRTNIAMLTDSRNADARARDLMNRIKQNNDLGDLGMENYCTHQLRTGIAMDKSQTANENFNLCDQARKSNKTDVLSSPACAGYPQKNLDEIKKVRAELDQVQREKNQPLAQPLFTLNRADNDVYSQFRNNYNQLVAAQNRAKQSLKLSYASSNLLRNTDAIDEVEEVTNCGENLSADNAFLDGLRCEESLSTLTDLTIQFQPSTEALKKLHRDKMITELNTHAFSEAIKSKWYLLALNDPLKIKMKNNPTEACREIADPAVCTGKYLEAFKKSVAEASSYSKPHFLSYTTDQVVKYMNDRLEWMRAFCLAIKEKGENGLIRISPQTYQDFEKVFDDMASGIMSPYLYDGNIRHRLGLARFRSESGQYCQGFNENENIKITRENIEKARSDFMEATDDQLDLSADFAKPGRGNHSNQIGRMICDVDMATKEDYYALNSLYRSHPFLTGQIIKGQESVQAKLFATAICEAKSCDKDLESTNDLALNAAKVSAIALNLVPGVGPALYAGTAGALEATAAIRDNVRANRSLSEMERGIATHGYEPIFDKEVGEVLRDLAEEGDVGKLIGELAIIAVTEYAGFKATHGIMHSLESALHAKGIVLSHAEHVFIDVMVHKAVMKGQDLTIEGIKHTIDGMSGEKIKPSTAPGSGH